jgi:glycerophosphoryl diester phosphodiesterase
MAYISFDYDILKRIHQLEPNAITQYLNGDIAPAVLKADGISGLDYHYSVFKKNPEWIQEAKKNNLQLNAWTVDDSTNMCWLLDNQFDYITTNQPELLFNILKTR